MEALVAELGRRTDTRTLPLPPPPGASGQMPDELLARYELNATASALPPASGLPVCANRRRRRTSITVPHVAWIARCSSGSPPANGSSATRICSSRARPAPGKTWLSCALGHRACRDNRSVLYQRVPRLLEALGLARGDGRYARMLKSLARVQLLILDDWAITPLTAEQRRDLMEIIDDRHDRASTVVTSQVPVEHWHEHIGNPTIADAVLDRLVHGAHRIELKGESMRKLRAAKAKLDGGGGQ